MRIINGVRQTLAATLAGVSWDAIDESGIINELTYVGYDYIPLGLMCSITAMSWVFETPIVTVYPVGCAGSNAPNDWLSAIVTIGANAFAGWQLSGTAVFPSAQTIGDNCFAAAAGITALTLGSTGHAVTSIGSGAFSSTSALETLTIYVTDPLNPPSGSPWDAGIIPTFLQA